MRLMLAVLVAAAVLTITGIDGAVTPASAQSCASLWGERNSYYKRHGYCFRTARAIRYFGNGGCYIRDDDRVPFTPWERNRIAQIQQLERRYGC